MTDTNAAMKAEAAVEFSIQAIAESIDNDTETLIKGIMGVEGVDPEEQRKALSRTVVVLAKAVEGLLMEPIIKFKKASDDVHLPSYETEGAAGADVRAFISGDAIELKPGERAIVPTGLSVDIPHAYEIQVRPRSGWAAKHGITVLNAPGTIDSDYKGEIGVILHNTSNQTFYINNGDRIAQFVVAKVTNASFIRVDDIGTSERGTGGFGSTGTN